MYPRWSITGHRHMLKMSLIWGCWVMSIISRWSIGVLQYLLGLNVFKHARIARIVFCFRIRHACFGFTFAQNVFGSGCRDFRCSQIVMRAVKSASWFCISRIIWYMIPFVSQDDTKPRTSPCAGREPSPCRYGRADRYCVADTICKFPKSPCVFFLVPWLASELLFSPKTGAFF